MAWSSTAALLRFTRRAAAGHGGAMALAFALALADLAALLALPLLSAALIDDLAGGRVHGFHRRLLLLAGLGVLQAMLGWVTARLVLRVEEGTAHALRHRLYARILAQPLAFLERRPLGDLLSRLLHDSAAFKSVPCGLLLQVAVDLATLAATGTLLARRHAGLALATLMAAPLPLLPPWLARRRLERQATAVRVAMAALTGSCQRWLARPLGLKAHGLEAAALSRVAVASRRLARQSRRLGRWQAGIGAAGALVAQAPAAVLFAYGGGLVLSGRLSLGDLFAFTGLAALFHAPLQRLIGLQATVPTLQPLRRRISSLMHRPGEPPQRSQPAPVALAVKGLTLERRGRRDWRAVVPGLIIAPGRPVTLTGPQGSGKSTLARHLAGLEGARSGAVWALSADGSRRAAVSARSGLALLTQHAEIHAATLLENITAFDPAPDRRRAALALQAVGLEPWRRALRSGWETALGAGGGLVLSQGQARLLDLARLLYRPARVWILDEPEQSLDQAGRRRLAAILRLAAPRLALLIISHHAARLPGGRLYRFRSTSAGRFRLQPDDSPNPAPAGAIPFQEATCRSAPSHP